MTLRGLIARCRERSLDSASPPFWTDQQWTDALNEAQDEACIRSRLIYDDNILISAVAGEAHITLPARAFSVCRVTVNGIKAEMSSSEYLDHVLGLNWDRSTGTPEWCYRVGNSLRLVPIPTSNADVVIEAFCTPSSQMRRGESNSDSPEIQERLHGKLVHWALHLFYSSQDADYANQNLADRHEAVFVSTFGPRPDEIEMRRTSSRPVRPVRCLFI
jgi:hypothetical protein